MKRPRIFIGSSVEGLDLARGIFQNLERDFEIVIWDQGVFLPSKSVLGQLISELENFQYAIFVFSPDDITTLRSQKKNSVRGNVIFETGLFMGRLGHENVFFVKPRNSELHIPSDLLGIVPGEYDADRTDNNLKAATLPFCENIKSIIKKGTSSIGTANKNIDHEKLLIVLENYIKTKQYNSMTFQSIIKFVDPILTESILTETIRLFPDRIKRCKLKNGFGVTILNDSNNFDPNDIGFMKGTWKNHHTINNRTQIEDLIINEKGWYYVDNEHWFTLENYKYDSKKNRLKFTKTAIRPKDTRKFLNDLTVESFDVLSGMEGNYKIKYIRQK